MGFLTFGNPSPADFQFRLDAFIGGIERELNSSNIIAARDNRTAAARAFKQVLKRLGFSLFTYNERTMKWEIVTSRTPD